MLFGRKLFTALKLSAVLATGAFSASAMADANHSVEAYTDMIVESAVYSVKQDLSLGVTYDVLTASHTFEPEADNKTLIAEITITSIEPEVEDKNVDDNDA